FSAPPTTYISPLSLHDALPIYDQPARARPAVPARPLALAMRPTGRIPDRAPADFPAVCVMGPTAAGKTELAVRLIEAFPFEIISVDSAMVYRGMDIGTAKPDAATLRRAPHRLIDLRDPEDTYSAGDFVRDARRAMAAIREAGRVPLLVGGTMMYFRALTRGLAGLP